MARWHQFLLALVFLTRLPLERALPHRILPLKASAWAFPLVGAVVGAVASVPFLFHGPNWLTAALSFGLTVWFTGALHEDALADFADAAGGKDTVERLQIMRDPQLGSFGVIALIVTSAIRMAAIAVLGPPYLIAAAACGRSAIVLTMGAMLPARKEGLSYSVGAPGARNVIMAALLAMVALVFLTDHWVLPLCSGLAVLSFVIWRARTWLGGHTGDVLGSASVLTEAAMLATFALTI